MALKRLRLVSWLVLLCLVVLIGAQIFPAPTSRFTASDASRIEKRSAYDQAFIGVVRIGTGEKARKTVPLVTTCSQRLCSRFSFAPPLIRHTVTAVPHSQALRVHQCISVYRI
jgi:hypothetical protein